MAVADAETGEVASQDVILGDAVVADMEAGKAYSFGAIAFQAGRGQNDGDKVYAFDGEEYARFPSVLATNFLTPTPDVEAQLILFTLDGTVGNLPVPRVKLGGYAYNDDEVALDFSYEFDGFDIVSLLDINRNFGWESDEGPGLGSVTGHLELVPQPIAAEGLDAHDAAFGDANNSRKRGVHGWLVQNVFGEPVPEDEPIGGAPGVPIETEGLAAWVRRLAQSTTALIPFLEDGDPTLGADPTGGAAPPPDDGGTR